MRILSLLTITLLSFCFTGCSEAEALAKPEAMMEKVKDAFTNIGTAVDSIKDADTAKSANTKITDLIGKVSGVLDLAKKLPAGEGSKIVDLVKEQAAPVLSKLTGLAPDLQAQVTGVISKLTELTK